MLSDRFMEAPTSVLQQPRILSSQILQMSVKDKIAMWNNIATNPTQPQPNPTKLVASETLPKPKQQEKQKKLPVNQTSHPAQEPTIPPPLACNFKKTESIEHPPPVVAAQVSKPSNLQQKPKDIVKPAEHAKEEKKEQGHAPPKFNDIKKQLEAQTAGKVAPPKKVETDPANRATECQIEKDTPKCSVKQQAAKLAVFYQQMHLKILKKNEENALNQVIEHQKPPVAPAQQTAPKEEQNNSLNIASHDVAIHPPIPELKQEKEVPKNKPAEQDPSGIDLALRAKNKNKMKKQQFESDDD